MESSAGNVPARSPMLSDDFLFPSRILSANQEPPVPFSCCSAIRSWSRPCGISASKSTTPWKSPNRRKS